MSRGWAGSMLSPSWFLSGRWQNSRLGADGSIHRQSYSGDEQVKDWGGGHLTMYLSAAFLSFKLKKKLLFYVHGFCLRVSVHHMRAQRPEEGVGSSKTDVCEWSCGCWESNWSPLEERAVVLTTEPPAADFKSESAHACTSFPAPGQ